ncbi:MAG: tetratricopeptide repeat protein [Candidatus Melainabacteria bacterium]|jgi:tetratricopeptide (TPR) repeat protein|nr:tetratricopeptide repeat protein [Candidatus Melainabacteria bacterium]
MATDKGFGGSLDVTGKRKQKGSKVAVAGLSGALLVACQAIAAMAAGTPAAIKSIGVDKDQQIVVQFANTGAFPAVPHLLDVPGPSHRVVFDFVDAALDRGTMPSPEIFSARIVKLLPQIKGVRYLNLTSTPKPTARIVIDLPENLEVKPRVVKLEEGLVVLSLGEGVDLTQREGIDPNLINQQKPAQAEGAVADATPAETAPAVSAPTPGESIEAAESAAASAPAAAAPAAAPAEHGAPAPGHVAAAQQADSESVGTWDWTAGQPAAVQNAKNQDVSTTPVVAMNTAETEAQITPASNVAPAQDPVQAELQKEAGAEPAAKVELRPEETPADRSAIKAELQKESGGVGGAAQPVELKPEMDEPAASAPAPVKAAAPVAAPVADPVAAPDMEASSEATIEPTPPAPVQRRAQAPVQMQKRAAAPVKEEPIEQEVRTETADQAPEKEIDGPSSAGELPTSSESKAQAQASYNKAVQAHLQGKLSEAISQYQNALTLNPEFSQAHCNLGLIYNQQHNYAKALSEFRKSLAINPKDAITYNGIGAALRAEKDMVGAIKNWQTAVSLDPKLATAHYNLGTAYEIQKDTDRAMESYRQAVKNDYRLGEAYYRMGLIMERKKLPDEASQQYEKALKVANNAEFSEDARQRLAALTSKKR